MKLLRCLDSSVQLVDGKGASKWSKRNVILFTINSKCTKLPKTKNKNIANNPTEPLAYLPPFTKSAKKKEEKKSKMKGTVL